LSFKLSVVFCARVTNSDLLTLVIIWNIPQKRPEHFFIIKKM
jgi:hypothetical protein